MPNWIAFFHNAGGISNSAWNQSDGYVVPVAKTLTVEQVSFVVDASVAAGVGTNYWQLGIWNVTQAQWIAMWDTESTQDGGLTIKVPVIVPLVNAVVAGGDVIGGRYIETGAAPGLTRPKFLVSGTEE